MYLAEAVHTLTLRKDTGLQLNIYSIKCIKDFQIYKEPQ